MQARLALALAILALAVLALACGGGDDPTPEDQARAAVADYLEAVTIRDEAEACNALSPSAQDQVVVAISKAPNVLPAETCTEAMTNLFGEGEPPDPAPQIPIVERLRSDEDPVPVSLDGNSGEVVFGPTKRDLTVPVESVDGEWLVSNGTGPLFPAGVDPVD